MLRRIALGLVAGTLSAATVFAQTAPPAPPAQPPAAAAAAPTTRTFASRTPAWCSTSSSRTRPPTSKRSSRKLKEALQKSEKPERKQQAASWKVFKSPDPAAGGNVLYVFIIDPAVKGADYTVSTILAEAFPPEVQTTLQAVRRGVRVRPELRQPALSRTSASERSSAATSVES